MIFNRFAVVSRDERTRTISRQFTMTSKPIHAPRGREISCKGWPQEAALRCLMNNLDPDVAEKPDELIVYGERQGGAKLGLFSCDRSRAARLG